MSESTLKVSAKEATKDKKPYDWRSYAVGLFIGFLATLVWSYISYEAGKKEGIREAAVTECNTPATIQGQNVVLVCVLPNRPPETVATVVDQPTVTNTVASPITAPS